MSGKEVRVDSSELVESIGTVEELRASDHTSIHASEELKHDESKSSPDHKSSSEIHPVHESSAEKKEDFKEEEKPELKETKKSISESSDSSSGSGLRIAKDEKKVEETAHKEEHKSVEHQVPKEEVKAGSAQTEIVLPEIIKEAHEVVPAAARGEAQSLLEKAKEYVNENGKYILGGVTIAALTLGALRFKRRRG
jgi:hypothetical protein